MWGIAVDPTNQTVYWTDDIGSRIETVSFDGSDHTTLLSDLGYLGGIAVVPSPEPATWVMLVIGAAALLGCGRRAALLSEPFPFKLNRKGGLMKSILFFIIPLTAVFAGSTLATAARAGDIFVTYGASMDEYTTSGATIQTSLVTGFASPNGMAVSGSDLFVTNYANNTVGLYDAATQSTINTALITGLSDPQGIAVSGGDLYVVNNLAGTIGEYTISGATINAALVTGLGSYNTWGITIAGGDLFITHYNSGTIGEYDATTGAAIGAALITGLAYPTGILATGGDLFVTNSNGNTVGEYTTSGAVVNASLITGLGAPTSIALDGGNLYVLNNYFAHAQLSQQGGSIGEYTLSGTPINTTLVGGLFAPQGIAVVDTPEPATDVMLLIGIASLLAADIRKRSGRAALREHSAVGRQARC